MAPPREIDRAGSPTGGPGEARTPPVPPGGLATGGTARALRRMGVEQLDPEGLEEALEELSRLRTLERAKRARVDLARAHTLPAGTIILAAVQALLQTPMRVADGGLREGVCIGLLSSMAASA